MKNSGFSLLELSIVLTVIGLIIGGVLVGQSMVRSAELTQIIADVEQYREAVAHFQSKYQSLPGDMPDAGDVWGTVCMTPATDCNGNGNKAIGGNTLLGGADPASTEPYLVWRHLMLAEMISGNFTGESAGAEAIVPGENMPEGPIQPGIYSFAWTAQTGNMISYSAQDTEDPSDFQPVEGILLPEDAANIDRKIDDGLPQQGRVLGNDGFINASCMNGTEYNFTDDERSCWLFFILNGWN